MSEISPHNQTTQAVISHSLIGPLFRSRGGASVDGLISLLVGAGCALVAGGLRYALTPLLGDQAPFLPFVLAVFAACIFRGLLAGVAAMVLAVVLAIGLIAPLPTHSQIVASVAHTLFFLIVCGILCSLMHRLQLAAKREHELLLATKEAATALSDANTRKDEFLAMLAHELRNPLAPIHNIAHLFSSTQMSAPLTVHYSAMLLRQTQQLTRLVDDLMDVSRITRGTITLKLESVAIDTILEGALETLRAAMAAKQQVVNVVHAEKPIVVFGDATRLSQVFSNLLGNASKYSGPGAAINVSLERSENVAIIRFRDHGIGIDATTLPRIFELFVQADQSLDRAHGGLGVGLTIVKRLVEMHGGKIDARSAGLGTGSEFIVQLPIELPQPTAMQ